MFITPLKRKMMHTHNHFSIFSHESGVFLEDHNCAASDKKKHNSFKNQTMECTNRTILYE